MSPPSEPSPAETVRAELDAVIAAEGLSRGAGERVLAAIDTAPEVFASASLDQLRAYVGAAVGAGDAAGVGRLVEAAPEASREALKLRARDAFWFQSDLDSWARDGLVSEYPGSVLGSLRLQPYWRRGTILTDSGLDDRLRLAEAIQLRLEQSSPPAPPELGSVFVRLRHAARSVEAPRFDALRGMGPPAPARATSRLAGYQRGLVTWARLEVDPTLDPDDPRSYDAARRLGWYHDRAAVLRFLAQGARLSSDETQRMIQQIDALSESQRLRFVGWFLGRQPEADKLDWIRAQARADGEAPTLGQRVDEADETESFLAAFEVSAPAELGTIDDLPSLLLVLDQWDLTAHGYIDAMRALRYQQLLREQRLAEQNQPNNRDGFHRSLKLWQSGGPENVVQFIAQVRRARDRARSAWSTLAGLRRLDGADSAEQTEVTTAVESARGVLGESRTLLAKLSKDADGFVDEIFERGKEAEALRSRATETAAESSWLASGLRGAFSAVGGFVDKLGEQLGDPKAWKTALEVGLEVAGATFSGGASVLIKLVKWLVTTGADLKTTVTGAVAKVRALAEPGALAKMVPLHHLTGDGLVSATVGALFGEVPAKPSIAEPVTEDDGKAMPQKGKSNPAERLLAKVGSLIETARGAAAKVIDSTWAALGKLDITSNEWFQSFARAYYRLMRFGDAPGAARQAVGNFVEELRNRLGTFFGGLRERLSAAVSAFADPAAKAAAWVAGVASSGLDYLVRLLIENPPSAILRTTFKLAADLLGTDTGDLAASIREKLAGVPLIGEMVAKIESTARGALEPLVQGPATRIHTAGQELFDQAEPAVQGLQNQVGGLLDDADAFAANLTDGKWSTAPTSNAEASPAQADGVAQTKRMNNDGSERAKESMSARPGEDLTNALAASFLGRAVQRRDAGSSAGSLPAKVRRIIPPGRVSRAEERKVPQSRGFLESFKAWFGRSAKATGKRHDWVRQTLANYFDETNNVSDEDRDKETALTIPTEYGKWRQQTKSIVKKVWKYGIIQDLHAARQLVDITGPVNNRECKVKPENLKELSKQLEAIRLRFQRETGIRVKALKSTALKLEDTEEDSGTRSKKNVANPKNDVTPWELRDPETSDPVRTRNLEEIEKQVLEKNYASFRWAEGYLVYISDLKTPGQLGELWSELAHEIATYYTLYATQHKIPTRGKLKTHYVVENAIKVGLKPAIQQLP